jgi:hypothetical protein
MTFLVRQNEFLVRQKDRAINKQNCTKIHYVCRWWNKSLAHTHFIKKSYWKGIEINYSSRHFTSSRVSQDPCCNKNTAFNTYFSTLIHFAKIWFFLQKKKTFHKGFYFTNFSRKSNLHKGKCSAKYDSDGTWC